MRKNYEVLDRNFAVINFNEINLVVIEMNGMSVIVCYCISLMNFNVVRYCVCQNKVVYLQHQRYTIMCMSKDRHRKGYYHDYNQAHPERLNRGFTKGYNNGNVSDGVKEKKRTWLNKTLGIYIIGYDELGRPITNNPLGDMLRNKEMEWHDDDWCESSWND